MENLKSIQADIDSATTKISALYAQRTALQQQFHTASESPLGDIDPDDIAKSIKRINFQIQNAEGERDQAQYRQQWLLGEQQRLQRAIADNSNAKLTLQKRLELLQFDTKNCNEDIIRNADNAKYLVQQLATLTGE